MVVNTTKNYSFWMQLSRLRDIGYISMEKGYLNVINVTTYEVINTIRTCNNVAYLFELTYDEQYLYQSCQTDGIMIIDISNYLMPRIIYSNSLPYNALVFANLISKDGTLDFITAYGNVFVYDVRVPTNPKYLTKLITG